ncbi:MAG: hypothetical protein WBW33_22735 [Bryobacteraceae bacterium]
MAAIEASSIHSRRHFTRGLCGAALGLAVAPSLRADRAVDVLRTLKQVAIALDDGNAAGALIPFDKSMAGYSQLEDYIVALTNEVSAHSDIDLVDEAGSETESKAVVRWILDLRDKVTNEEVDRRVKEVHIRLVAVKDKPGEWKIVALEPIDLFNPIVQ